MKTTQAAIVASIPLALATQLPLGALAQDNCYERALESAIRSGLVTQVGRKTVLGDPIHLPSCGKTVSELVIDARGHDPV